MFSGGSIFRSWLKKRRTLRTGRASLSHYLLSSQSLDWSSLPYSWLAQVLSIGQFKQIFRRKILIIYISISLNMCFGCSKEETVLLSTHNICFGWEIKKKRFSVAHFYFGAWGNPLCTNEFFHLVWHDVLGIVPCIYRGVAGYTFIGLVITAIFLVGSGDPFSTSGFFHLVCHNIYKATKVKHHPNIISEIVFFKRSILCHTLCSNLSLDC